MSRITVTQAGCVLQPRQGRLGAQVAAGVGQPPASELEGGIGAQRIEVVGILVTAADGEDPGADHVGDRVGDAGRIAPVGDQPRQVVGDPKPLLGHAQQHDPAVRGEPSSIEGGGDLLAPDGWKIEAGDRSVDHGGRGSARADVGLV